MTINSHIYIDVYTIHNISMIKNDIFIFNYILKYYSWKWNCSENMSNICQTKKQYTNFKIINGHLLGNFFFLKLSDLSNICKPSTCKISISDILTSNN